MEYQIKRRASRDELLGQDEYASSWADHQQFRIERILSIVSHKKGVPASVLKLSYRSKFALELFSRTGERIKYRPQGHVVSYAPGDCGTGTLMFNVCWVDPWGFAHSAEHSFLDIILRPVVEIEYQRYVRQYRDAVERKWVSTT